MDGRSNIRAHVIVLLSVCCLPFVRGLPEVCMFYNLHADCYYKIDFISISRIRAEIDQCTDPIEVTFRITNERPSVDFEHTFSSTEELVAIHGFDKEVQLHVQLNMKDKVTINVEADLYVGSIHKTDFINTDVKLNGQNESCPFLNKAAQIAMGIMGGLVIMAAILIFVLLYVRWRRRKKSRQNSNNDLIRNAENPGLSTPTRRSQIIEETETNWQQVSPNNGHVRDINRTANSISRSENNSTVINGSLNRSGTGIDTNGPENGTVTNYSINRSDDRNVAGDTTCDNGQMSSTWSRDGYHGQQQQDSNATDRYTTKETLSAAANQLNEDQRYSDLMQRYNQNQYKISDC